MHATLLLSALLSGGAIYSGAVYDSSTGSALPLSGGVMTGDLDMDGNDIIDPAWIYRTVPTSDTAASAGRFAAGNAYGGAAVNTTGGSVYATPGIGSRSITIVGAAAMAGDTLTITVNGTATVLTEGASYACAAVTAAECACAIYTRLAGTPITGVSPGRTNATCTDAKVWFTPTVASTWSLTVTPSDTAGATLTQVNGTDGQFLIGNKGWAFADDTNTGFYLSGADMMWFLAGGSAVGMVDASRFYVGKNLQYAGSLSSGSMESLTAATETVTFAGNPGDATKVSTALIPDGAFLRGVTGRVIVAGTNCASFSIGDGVDPNLWGNAISPALGTTFGNADATANWSNPMLAAQAVTLTANGGNCFDLSVRLAIYYSTFTAPTN